MSGLQTPRLQFSSAGSHSGTIRTGAGNSFLNRIPYKFHEIDPDGPVCVIVPGFRSRGIDTPDNAEMMDDIAYKAGMSVISFDYSGAENFVKSVDPITMDSNVEDALQVMNLFPGRKNLIMAKSFGLNIGLSAVNEDTQGMVGAIPVSDLFDAKYKPHFERKPAFVRHAFDAILKWRGFYCWKPSSDKFSDVPFVKITRPYVASFENHTLPKVFERNTLRVPVHLIANDGDKIASPERTQSLMHVLQNAGYPVTMEIVEGKRHRFSEHTHSAAVAAVGDFAREL